MNRRNIQYCVGLVALVAALIVHAVPASAGDDFDDRHRRSCRGGIVGTHLLTFRDGNGAINSRSVATFHEDGAVSAIDSTQGLGVENAAFTMQLGTYKCTGRRSAVALLLDFGFSEPPDIGRTDWTIELDRRTGNISGSITLFIVPNALSADPLADAQNPIGPFTFDGVRVPARVR